MLAISRKTEYGIIALRYMMMRGPETLCTAREIAHRFKISEQLMAKILQKLARANLIASTQGVRGGYSLYARPKEVSIARIIEIIDGPFGIVDCVLSEETCDCVQFQEDVCNIRETFSIIQSEFKGMLERISLADFAKPKGNGLHLIHVNA